MKLRQQVPSILSHGRVGAPEERLPDGIQTLDAEEIVHENMILSWRRDGTGMRTERHRGRIKAGDDWAVKDSISLSIRFLDA